MCGVELSTEGLISWWRVSKNLRNSFGGGVSRVWFFFLLLFLF